MRGRIGGPTSAPIDVGNQAADDVLAFRHADHSNQANLYADTTGYQPKNQPMAVLLPAAADAIDHPGRWQALTYLNAAHEAKTPRFICPHWGLVKPFALASGSQLRPTEGPRDPLSQGFLDQALHVMDIQARLTPEQKVIAEYWADGPNSELPPGHWTEFAAFVAERDKLDLTDSVRLYFALANAIFDASIATWDAKRAFDYVRPEFTSGHSAFSMAAATVLKLFTGSDRFGFFYAQETPLKADPGVPVTDVVLHWPTFTAAAREAGESRLYGGIHFYEGNVVGLDLGEKVGQAAFARAQKFWSGA